MARILTEAELAAEFGVVSLGDIADDLYADYLDFVADGVAAVEETEA